MTWIELIQTVGIISSILLAVWQIRVQTGQVRSATNTALAATVDEINRLMFEHPNVFPEFAQPYPTQGNGQTRDRRYHLMQMILNTFEQAFQQHKYGFVDRAAWDSWTRTMKEILGMPYAQGHWQEIKILHTTEFQKLIDGLTKDPVQRAGD